MIIKYIAGNRNKRIANIRGYPQKQNRCQKYINTTSEHMQKVKKIEFNPLVISKKMALKLT